MIKGTSQEGNSCMCAYVCRAVWEKYMCPFGVFWRRGGVSESENHRHGIIKVLMRTTVRE